MEWRHVVFYIYLGAKITKQFYNIFIESKYIQQQSLIVR